MCKVGSLVILGLMAAGVLLSCKNNKHGNSDDQMNEAIDILTISCVSSEDAQLSEDAYRPEFVILREDDNTMFADVNQIIDAYGKYFVVDAFGSNKVVAFDYDGKPFASYGKRGNGPGEYLFPCGVDVDAEFVYVLDPSRKQLHKYRHDGRFVKSLQIPFRCNAFALIDNEQIIFNLAPSNEDKYQLCVTDSSINPMSYQLKYPDNFVDSWMTNNAFRKTKNGLNYYISPLDTIYRLNYSGDIIGKRVLNFKEGSISEDAKLNFLEASDKIQTGLHLLDNPIELPSGLCVSEIDAYNNGRDNYIVFTYPSKGSCCAKKYGDHMSVFDVIEPQSLTSDGRILGILDGTLAGECYDFDRLPDGVAKALNEGCRVLVIHNL